MIIMWKMLEEGKIFALGPVAPSWNKFIIGNINYSYPPFNCKELTKA